MIISHLDHLVLTVRDVSLTCEFYSRILGFSVVTFGNNRFALQFGNQKINLHEFGKEIEPKASFATPGSADLCFIAETPVEEVLSFLVASGVTILEGGVVERTGAMGRIRSVYFRDLDGNLLEVSNYG